MLSDIEIAQAAKPEPIAEIAAKLGLGTDEIETFGRYKAKVPTQVLRDWDEGDAKLVLVTGISPTPAGEGKSTVSVGLADALNRRGHNPVLCLREPSLGPVFGIKGGATGGGYSQVIPMEDINLHFTGDFHAITSSHALLSAMLDNHLFRPNTAGIDPRRVMWRRALDMNDRALRQIVIGLGGTTGGIPREDGFQITAASEVMAVFCLADGLTDLQKRLGNIIVAYDRELNPVCARDLNAESAMTVLLKDALAPNLVQTLEGTPAFIHGGPFANIAHGCNSLSATRAGLKLGDMVVTEAGFGADLGAEKFFDIKCRFGGLRPSVAVVVATIRALKMHGGVSKDRLGAENVDALKKGLENLIGHVENVRKFGVPPVVAINRFATDTEAEIGVLLAGMKELGVPVAPAEGHAKGGEGVLELADVVHEVAHGGAADFKPLYPDELSLAEKIETIAREIYGAEGVDFAPAAQKELDQLEKIGMGSAPVCVAKTQYSFSDDPTLLGRPKGFRITVRELTPSAGAGFVVAKTGTIMTMPGLAATPAAQHMGVGERGTITGLA